jgi:hypothetical protein
MAGPMAEEVQTMGVIPDADNQRTSESWWSWVNVFVAAVLMLATLPGRTQGLGLITEPLLKDLHIDRVSYASINLWAVTMSEVIEDDSQRI